MRKFSPRTRNLRARWAVAPLFCLCIALTLSIDTASARDSDNVAIFLDAVERQRVFSEKIKNRERAEIALNFLDEKFPGTEICYYQGDNLRGEVQKKITGKIKIDLNQSIINSSEDNNYIYFVTNNRYFVYHLNERYFGNMAYFINTVVNKDDSASKHCIKARHVIMLVDAS